MKDKLKNRISNWQKRAQTGENEESAQQLLNEMLPHLGEISQALSQPTACSDSLHKSQQFDPVETIANDYYELIKFVLKRMQVRHFDEIHFISDKDTWLGITIIQSGVETTLDFAAYVHHNDAKQTEYRMEIEGLYSDDLDWQQVIALLKEKDWRKYKTT